MHQNALTCQYHEKQQSVLPTYEEVIRIGPSNQPPSAPLDGFLTPSAVVQVPLSNPPNYTQMPFPSTLYPYPPTNFPTPLVPPTNGDPQNGENPPTPTVAYKFPTAFKLTTLDKCCKLINDNHLFS